jgi:restriction system protein
VGRGVGFASFIRAAARASAAAERERHRIARRRLTEARREERSQQAARIQAQRERRESERQAKRDYVEAREAEASGRNSELAERIAELEGVLGHTLNVNDSINFDLLRRTDIYPPFEPPPDLAPGTPPEPRTVLAPSGLAKFLPGASSRHEREAAEAERGHREELEAFRSREREKRARYAALKADYDSKRAAFELDKQRHNAEVDEFKSSYFRKDADAVVAYSEMVLARSDYPDGFPQGFKVAYSDTSRDLVVEYDLPLIEIVPEQAEYRYAVKKDEIEPKPRKATERKQLYQDVIASIALRTIHELLEADQADAIAVVTFTGMLDAIDPTNGLARRVPLISVRAPKADVLAMRLDRVDKALCLKNLGAKVSARPDELQAVKPIVEFNMVDKRFVEQGDALSVVESRPNLMELTPSEFETLVANLFGRMGLESKLTRASRDGGVDAVAFDTRPVLGGKVVIQAKRYKNTVGVEAVRDLYGTMLNEGANKGVLVTTSGFGPDAFEFSKDKPVELIDGGGLLFLLREHARLDARIVI